MATEEKLVQDLRSIPQFSGAARYKLDGLLGPDRGWSICGYAIEKDGAYGLVTTGGFVGWWTVASENAARAEARATAAEARVAQLETALKPFADGMAAYEQHCRDEMDWVPPPERCDDDFVEMLALTGNYVKLFKIGELRAARTALSQSPDRESGT